MIFSIRSATAGDAASIARVDVECWLAAYKDILPSEFLQSRTIARRELHWSEVFANKSEQFVLIAHNQAGNIIGFVHGGTARKKDPIYKGEVYAIYILPSSQREGVGRELFYRAAEQLRSRGHRSLLVWVLSMNSARKFYEALGGKLLGSVPNRIAGMTLEGLSYGWEDSSLLTPTLQPE